MKSLTAISVAIAVLVGFRLVAEQSQVRASEILLTSNDALISCERGGSVQFDLQIANRSSQRVVVYGTYRGCTCASTTKYPLAIEPGNATVVTFVVGATHDAPETFNYTVELVVAPLNEPVKATVPIRVVESDADLLQQSGLSVSSVTGSSPSQNVSFDDLDRAYSNTRH